MNNSKKIQEKHENALDAMWDLFKYGRAVENDLETSLLKALDEIQRIKVICGSAGEVLNQMEEIKGICRRALT